MGNEEATGVESSYRCKMGHEICVCLSEYHIVPKPRYVDSNKQILAPQSPAILSSDLCAIMMPSPGQQDWLAAWLVDFQLCVVTFKEYLDR